MLPDSLFLPAFRLYAKLSLWAAVCQEILNQLRLVVFLHLFVDRLNKQHIN